MARRTGRSQGDTNQNAEAPAEAQTQEEAVVTATTEAPVETPENDTPAEAPAEAQGESTEAPKEAEKPIDLSDFEAAVDAAIAEKDDTTGALPVIVVEKVKDEYRKLDGLKAKNKAKALINERLSDRMNSGKLEEARSYFQLGEEALVAAAGGAKKESTPADPTEAFVQLVASLSLGYGLAYANPPESVKEGWEGKVNELVEANRDAASTYATWFDGDTETRGDEPEVAPFVKAAVKLARGKAARAGAARSSGGGSTYTGERRDIGKHIVEAFSGKEEGTFMKIAEIRGVDTSEYKAGEASAGAISARLFPDGDGSKSTMLKVGIRPDYQNGKKGAVLVNSDGSPVE